MISVILPTRNPHEGRFARTLGGLASQSLPRDAWELLVVDNGSSPPLSSPAILALGGRVVVEPSVGLTRARLCGMRAARGDILVFVDDDNVLEPDYLAQVHLLLSQHAGVGAAGGVIRPEFEQLPPEWAKEFLGLLALQDFGPEPIIAAGGAGAPWPSAAPVGAGLCLRSAAARHYVEAIELNPERLNFDRAGSSLASGGDNDMVFTALHAGYGVAYFPSLQLTHLIPATRLRPDYLARLNRGIMRTWVRVLALHGQCPWPPILPATLGLRQLRAWWRFRAWRSPANFIRWQGACGQFEGQADLRLASSQ